MASKLILIGGGGHCKACINVIESLSDFEILGIIDKQEKIGEKILDYTFFGTDDDIQNYVADDTYFLITLGQIKSSRTRETLFKHLISIRANIATIISPIANVSKYAKIDMGTIVMHGAMIGPHVSIGKNCIINTGSDIEHDCIVGDHSHISTHAVVNGNCEIGNGVFVGSNATLLQGVSVVTNAVIGAGVLVRKDILKEGVFINN